MDNFKTTFPQFQVKNKMVFGLGQLLMTLTGMITHGHGDETFVQYSNEPNYPNFMIGSHLHLFCSQLRSHGFCLNLNPKTRSPNKSCKEVLVV
jgi:hypothetical protein